MKRERDDTHFEAFPDAALQRAWIRQLRSFYDLYNEQYVASVLQPPLLRLGESAAKLGEWDPQHRVITISTRHILEHSWESVLDTLRHEMAHQYVHEALTLPHAKPHGPAFEKACELLRCAAGARAAEGSLGPLAASRTERDRMLARVKELLALAQSPNEHEAASAMRMANRYLLKYNLDLAEVENDRSYLTRYLGRCSGRVQEYEYTLAHILQEHFFVLVVWTYSYQPLKNTGGRILEISGTEENVEIASYVYAYVQDAAAQLWQNHRRDYPDARGTRLQYLAGLVSGLDGKLDRGRVELRKEHGLVWLGDKRLKEFFRHQHPQTRSVSRGGVSRGERYHAGREDGESIQIHKGVGGSARSRGRLLE
jgi:hypothetical protein